MRNIFGMFSLIKWFLSSLLFVFFVFFARLPTDALVVSPAVKKIYVRPGEQIIEIVSVVNETKNSVTLFPFVENFKSKNDFGTPEFLGDSDPEGSARWIQLPFNKVTLLPHERKDFLFKINIPKWAVPGGHYAALFWTTHKDGQQGVSSVTRVGSLFLFGVEGKITGEITMANAKVVKNKNYDFDGFSFVIANKSNIHIAPKGRIEIYNLFGKRVAELPLNAPGKNVLAQSSRTFFEQWKHPYYSYGKLRAHIRSEFDFGFPAVEHDVEFYNLPRFAVVKILFAIACALFVFKTIYKRNRLKKEHSLILDS